jgi:hypothetical protein
MTATLERDQEHDKDHDKGPAVEVLYLNSNEEAKFHASWDTTLQQVWDRGYTELGESRREGDEIQCQEGASLMSYLSLTLEQLRERHICPDRKFAIRSATGGA